VFYADNVFYANNVFCPFATPSIASRPLLISLNYFCLLVVFLFHYFATASIVDLFECVLGGGGKVWVWVWVWTHTHVYTHIHIHIHTHTMYTHLQAAALGFPQVSKET
jgi:hypothetical protein